MNSAIVLSYIKEPCTRDVNYITDFDVGEQCIISNFFENDSFKFHWKYKENYETTIKLTMQQSFKNIAIAKLLTIETPCNFTDLINALYLTHSIFRLSVDKNAIKKPIIFREKLEQKCKQNLLKVERNMMINPMNIGML